MILQIFQNAFGIEHCKHYSAMPFMQHKYASNPTIKCHTASVYIPVQYIAQLSKKEDIQHLVEMNCIILLFQRFSFCQNKHPLYVTMTF